MIRPLVVGLSSLALALLCACGVTPQTPVPDPLSGSWSNGSVSTVNFYDPGTGSWAPESGSGFSWELRPDGTYVAAGLLQSTLYSCTMTVFSYTEGTVAVEDQLVTFYPTYDRVKSKSNCNDEYNFDQEGAYEVRSFLWEVVQDDYGQTLIFYEPETGEEYSRYTRD